jgi:hypothetical protein
MVRLEHVGMLVCELEPPSSQVKIKSVGVGRPPRGGLERALKQELIRALPPVVD